MGMHGGHGRPGGHGRIGGPRGHGMHGRPGGSMPRPFPMFGYGGMMGIGWLIAPFMGMLFMTMFFGEMIGSVTNFTTILGLLCMVGAFYILYQMRSKSKTKRKQKSYSDEYDSTYYDDEFYDE